MKAKQKAEAIKRMKTMGIHNGVISQFEEENIVVKSKKLVGVVGAFYALTAEEKKWLVRFEEDHNALVYMIIQ